MQLNLFLYSLILLILKLMILVEPSWGAYKNYLINEKNCYISLSNLLLYNKSSLVGM